MKKHRKENNFYKPFYYAESGLSFSSFIWKLEKKNNPNNPVNPV